MRIKFTLSLPRYNYLFIGLLSLIAFPAELFAVTIDPSGATIFNALDNTTTDTLLETLSNLLSDNSVVIQFARSLFIGLTVVMLVLYLIQFARAGTDALDVNGIYFFVISVVIVSTFLYLPATVTANGLSITTLWIGKIAVDIYTMSITAGQLFFDAATGGQLPAGEGIEPLVKVIFRVRLIDNVTGFSQTVAFYIFKILIYYSHIILVGIIWVLTSILSVATAIMGVFLIITIPLVLFAFGKNVFLSVVNIIIGLQAAILGEWLAAAICINIFGEFLGSPLTMAFLNTNTIDIPVNDVLDAVGFLLLIFVCIIIALVMPVLAGAISGGAAVGRVGNSALRVFKVFK